MLSLPIGEELDEYEDCDREDPGVPDVYEDCDREDPGVLAGNERERFEVVDRRIIVTHEGAITRILAKLRAKKHVVRGSDDPVVRGFTRADGSRMLLG